MTEGLRLPGRPESNNPLVHLNEGLAKILVGINRIADATEGKSNRHEYGLAIAELPQHGKVWGSYCSACSAQEESYVYPCKLSSPEAILPPQFFTIDKVFSPRGDGAFVVSNGATPTD